MRSETSRLHLLRDAAILQLDRRIGDEFNGYSDPEQNR